MYSPVQGLFRLPGGFLDLGSPVTPAPSSSLAPGLPLCFVRRFAPGSSGIKIRHRGPDVNRIVA
jgi:hypothetical protein